MILNINPIIERIREADFASASLAKAKAIYGILRALDKWMEDGDDLTQELLRCHPEIWEDKHTIEGYEQADTLWAALSLKERLFRLQAFYQTNIHELSGGDDQKAHQLLATADRVFKQCRQEAFGTCDSRIEDYLLYFHVLCLARPGYRYPDHVRLYLDYNRLFNVLPIESYDEDSDLVWQYREVRWRRNMLHEQFFDRSLLPHLSFADKEACETFRLQCYKWMLFLDPEDDSTIQMERRNMVFAAECVRRVYEWLDAKYANHIDLQPEVEANALLTIYCGINYSGYAQHCLSDVEEWAYDLLDRLPASRLKTRLMCQMVISNEDPDLADAVNADIATWDTTQLTDEDKYLKELLNPALA